MTSTTNNAAGISNEELMRRALQRGACRLCMAPNNECVPIFATLAADKEPLAVKILSCLGLRVSSSRTKTKTKAVFFFRCVCVDLFMFMYYIYYYI